MGAINPNALSKFVGILEVAPQASPGSLVRIASVRGLVANFDNTANQVDIKADDTGTVFKGFLPEVRIEGSFLENVVRDLMQLLLGGTPGDVAASIVNNHVQTVAQDAWDYGTFLAFDHQNGDGTAPNLDSVTGSTDGLLTIDVDYTITSVNGIWGIVMIAGTNITVITQSLAVQIDYTPNAAENITIPVTFTESPRLYLKITATDANGDDRIIILDDCTFEGTYGIEFLDVVEAGDLKGTDFVFKASKGSNFILQNEIL
ncbi:MAG: hypothetical protein V4549_03695 [Bacteroidota bacterium]